MTTQTQTTECPRSTPWGEAQQTEKLIPGLWFVSTASHGGVFVARERRSAMPAYMRTTGYSGAGWYEEDLDYILPYMCFWDELEAAGKQKHLKKDDAIALFRNWHPDKYEQFFKVALKPGESHVRDERTFNEESATKLVVTSAYGDWHDKVPNGFVGVIARIGGSREAGAANRYFIVPAAEYAARGKFCFVVNPDVHIEVKEEF